MKHIMIIGECKVCGSHGNDLLTSIELYTKCRLCTNIYSYDNHTRGVYYFNNSNNLYLKIKLEKYFSHIASLNLYIIKHNLEIRKRLVSKLCWDKYNLNIPNEIESHINSYINIPNLFVKEELKESDGIFLDPNPVPIKFENSGKFNIKPYDNNNICIQFQLNNLKNIVYKNDVLDSDFSPFKLLLSNVENFNTQFLIRKSLHNYRYIDFNKRILNMTMISIFKNIVSYIGKNRSVNNTGEIYKIIYIKTHNKDKVSHINNMIYSEYLSILSGLYC